MQRVSLVLNNNNIGQRWHHTGRNILSFLFVGHGEGKSAGQLQGLEREARDEVEDQSTSIRIPTSSRMWKSTYRTTGANTQDATGTR